MVAERIKQKLEQFVPLNSVLDYKVSRLLLHHPYKLFYYYLYKKLVYSKTQKGVIKKITTFFGEKMNIMLPASLDLFFFGLKSHPSEISLSKFMLNTLKEGDSMVDIGAHFGYYTLLASRIVGEGGKVFSVEASPETFSILKLNTSHSRNIEIRNMAISDVDDSTVKFCVFPVFYSEMNTLNPDQYTDVAWYGKVKGKMVEVEATTLSTFISRNGIKPKIIKIDVEGAEGLVIRGSINKMDSLTGVPIIIEYVNDSKSPEPYLEAESLLTNAGFRSHYIKVSDGQLEPISGTVLDFMKSKGLVSENIVFIKN